MPHWLVTAVLITALWCMDSHAAQYQCPNSSAVTIVGDDTADNDFICASAARAFAFLDRFGLLSERPVTVRMIERPVVSTVGLVYGSYDPYTDQVLLMHFAAIMSLPDVSTLFSDRFDRDDYAGIIAHELTHAMVQDLLAIDPYAGAHEYVVAQEYLAYATQIAVMPEQRKRSLVEKLDVEAWQPGHIISAVYMAFAPHKFAVKSYLHLVGMDDPQPFIASLLKTPGLDIYAP